MCGTYREHVVKFIMKFIDGQILVTKAEYQKIGQSTTATREIFWEISVKKPT